MLPAAVRPRLFDWTLPLWFFGFLVLFGGVSVWLGGDGTPDFKIYHFYNGYAVDSGGRPQDIAAAQLQTYFFPGTDALYYALVRRLNNLPLLARVVFALPNVVAVFLVFRIADLVLPAGWPLRRLVAAGAALYGCIGTAILPTMGTAMSDLVAGSFVMLALWIWLAGHWRFPITACCLAGLSGGIAVGLKLTCGPFFVALLLAVLFADLARPRAALRHGLLFGAMGAAGCLAVAGWWWLRIYHQFGDPLFPAFNDFFRSDMIAASRWSDDRFKPEGWRMALLYPLVWAFADSHQVIELNIRDPRILSGLIGSLIALIGTLTGVVYRRLFPEPDHLPDATRPLLALFFVVSYALWEAAFSIYRYLSVLEALTGVMALAAVVVLAHGRMRLPATLALAALLGSAAWYTHYPWWSRSAAAAHIIEVTLPDIAPDSMVILLDPYATSYLVPFMPPSVRVIGANNNLLRPGSVGRLPAEVEAAIRAHTGPLWGLEDARDFPGDADRILTHYGLRRAPGCASVVTNIDDPKVVACPLTRAP